MRTKNLKLDLRQIQRNLRRLQTRMPKEAARVFEKDVVRPAFQASQEDVPVDTGALKASGRVEKSRTTSGPVWDIRYGNEKVDYALPVHELHEDPKRKRYLAKHVISEEPKSGWKRAAGKLRKAMRKIVR